MPNFLISIYSHVQGTVPKTQNW